MAALKDKRAKAEGRLLRATKALENAKKELADLVAAERVMAEITGQAVDSRPNNPALTERDKEITKLLGVSPAEARTPVELHAAYAAETGDEINLDAFRTALWRLQKKEIQGDSQVWLVRSESGRYWREPAEDSGDDIDDEIGALLG